MKRFSTIALMFLLVVAFSLPASASAATSPGVKPGSFFYFFDTTFEKIGLFFTFNPENKARKALEYADERLAEAEAVTDNAEAVKTAIINYESNIAFAEEKSKDVGDKEKAEALFTSIADNTSKHQEVLTAVLVKVPDEAKEAITGAIEASRKGHEEAMQKIAELKGEVEKLKQEVAELKAKDEERKRVVEELSKQKAESPATQQKISAPTPSAPTQKPENTQPQTSSKTSIVTLPNGAIVEMDASGKILRYIKEAPVNTTTPVPTTPVAPHPTATPTQTEILEITSVLVTPDMTSAKIEWQTNKPTESKVFISGGSLSSKIFTSASGLSTRHSATVMGLSEETTYFYEIEAIAGGISAAKKSGGFKTLPPPPLFEFNPVVKVGGTNSNGTHWYPQLIDKGSGGYTASDIGHVYFSINESFDSGTWSVKEVSTGQYNIAPRGYTIAGRAVKQGEIVDLTGFGAGQAYEYKFTMDKAGFRSNTKTGTFTAPTSRIYTEKTIKPWPDTYPGLHGEFFFWHWGGGLEGSILNLKIKVVLKNSLSPNELKFYKSGIANLWQTFSNISSGDVLEINSFPSNYQLIWSYSGNPDDLSLDIIEGTATKSGASVLFKF